MSEIHSCGYFCQIPACVLKQRDTLRDKLQTSESADNNQHAGSAILVTFSPDSQTWKIERDHGLALTSQPAPKGVNTLQDAAQAVLHRWDSSKWDWAKQGPTADLMAALRVAVEAQAAPAVAPTNPTCSMEPIKKDALTDLIKEHLKGTLHCTADWSLWLSDDVYESDFKEVCHSDTPLKLADAILNAFLSHPVPAELSKVVELERARCVAIAYKEYQIRENAALWHPMGSDERLRCLAGARAASNITNGIFGGKPAPAVAVPVGYKLVPIAMSKQNTQLLRHSLHQITAGDFEPTLQEVAEIYAAATGLETTQSESAVQALQPLNRARVQSLIDAAGYVHAEQKAHFINGIRHAEMAHGITATPQPEPTVPEGVKP